MVDVRTKVRRYMQRIGLRDKEPESDALWRFTTNHRVFVYPGQRCIYGIADPRDHVIRYVGFTKSPIQVRLRRHMQNPTNVGMAIWMERMRRDGVFPEIVALEAIGRKQSWSHAEKKWITRLRVLGSLLNVENGGKTSWNGRRYDRQVAGGPVRILSKDEVQKLNDLAIRSAPAR